MKRKHLLFILVSIILLNACPMDRFWFFVFRNLSSEDIFIITDPDTQDNVITVGSEIDFVYKNKEMTIQRRRLWTDIIKDSAYIYVVDASKIDLHVIGGILSEDQKEKLSPEMILDTLTLNLINLDDPWSHPIIYPIE